ncbi:MAG: hypothetical protein HY332_05285 [Chloroflexi bacterium]|nr:hypothetical protein [Chloroflexota bacterium]
MSDLPPTIGERPDEGDAPGALGKPDAPRAMTVPWGTIASLGAAGALLIAFFVAQPGSAVALTIALLFAVALGTVALVMAVARVRRERITAIVQHRLPATAEELGSAVAQESLRRLNAPAAAVLVPRGGRLVPAASAGDWALARQRPADATANVPATQLDDRAPPEFPLDDVLPRLLGLYPRAIPVERWRELSDVPVALLPLAALANRGAGVAVTLRHRQRLVGLLVLARRPKGKAYTDAELRYLERLAQQVGPALAGATRQ